MEAYRYISPRGLFIDYTLPKEMRIDLPEPAKARLSAILSSYNRDIQDWFDEVGFHVAYRRNIPFATVYFDKQYPLGGYITANRWDKFDSPYQYYSSDPDPEMMYAGAWWFRTKERLEYASHRSSIAAKVWELLYDKSEFSPWVVFAEKLDDEFVTAAQQLNLNLFALREMDADLEKTFPYNGEELIKVFQKDMLGDLGGTTIWCTNPFISDDLDLILKPYQKRVYDITLKISSTYNSLMIKPWLTVWLNREYDLTDYFHNDCGLGENEIKTISFTNDFATTPEEFDHHVPVGIIYFNTKEDASLCAQKSSLIGHWWEKVKNLHKDRGWLFVPSDDLRAYEATDLFVLENENTLEK